MKKLRFQNANIRDIEWNQFKWNLNSFQSSVDEESSKTIGELCGTVRKNTFYLYEQPTGFLVRHLLCNIWYVNVNVTVLSYGEAITIESCNWINFFFCGIWQMMPLKVWPNTALGYNHQSVCMPQLQPLCSAALVPYVPPRKDEGSGKPCAVIEAL